MPLAFSALSNAFKVNTLWLVGDYVGAQRASDRVKTFGKISLALFVVLVLLYIIFVAVMFASIGNAASSPYS